MSCISAADEVSRQVEQMRSNAEIFQETCTKAAKYEINFRPLRTRGNANENDPLKACEIHHRQQLFNPLLEFYASQMRERFTKHREVICNLSALLPRNVNTLNEDSAENFFQLYPDEVTHHLSVVQAEIESWRAKWADASAVPENALDTLNACGENFFPTVFKLLRIFTTLPVTTAHAERSFSRLGRIKDKRRSTMTENRLNGLTLLSEHRDIPATAEEVLDAYCMKKRRRLALVL